MAEIAVGVVTDKLIPLLADEVSLLKGVHSKVERVKGELLLIQAFLKDADAKAENSSEPNLNAVKEWVKQLREVAFRIEDVVDLYLLKVAERRHHAHHRLGFVVKICFCIKSIMPRHEISSEIEGHIKRLTEAKETLGLSPNTPTESGPNGPHGLRMGAHFIDDDELVGVDQTKEELTYQLLSGGSKRRVIAVVGEGGLGKTTIVKNLYEKQKERKSFECYAWVTVSRSLKGEHLLKAIIAAMEISGRDMSKEDLIKKRISFHGNFVEHEVERYRSNYGRIRSCFVCHIEELKNPMVEMLLSSFKLLVALDFENSRLDHLPESVGMLLNLKYLNLRNTKIKVIPKFIGKLQNLETLDLQDTEVRELPKEINKLIKLRHLLVYASMVYYQPGGVHGMLLNKGVGCLTALQSLAMVDTIDQDYIIEELKNLKSMRWLEVIISKTSGSQLCNAIKNMTHLSSLLISAADNEESGGLELQSSIDPPPYLQRLYLRGRLESLPEWIPKLKNLVKLSLIWSRLNENPLPALKNLPELIDLFLFESYEGVELSFQEGEFPKLKCLGLLHLPRLRTLKFGEEALPLLETLWLESFPQMVQGPVNIQNLESLKELHLNGMHPHVVKDIETQLKETITLYVN
ncbi:hypothetical protein RJT34_10723 [Clitoria ternatea]|uniref:Uncharacterized protein n=1 Tax=Clitoria ternatea TaxID=43366 RepID=A0AAN9JKJ0_CLITE